MESVWTVSWLAHEYSGLNVIFAENNGRCDVVGKPTPRNTANTDAFGASTPVPLLAPAPREKTRQALRFRLRSREYRARLLQYGFSSRQSRPGCRLGMGCRGLAEKLSYQVFEGCSWWRAAELELRVRAAAASLVFLGKLFQSPRTHELRLLWNANSHRR